MLKMRQLAVILCLSAFLLMCEEDSPEIAPYRAVRVIFPNGGEVFHLGETVEIRWETMGVSNDLDIHILKGGVLDRKLHENHVRNDGSWQWTIPVDMEPDMDYKVWIVCSDPVLDDVSDGTFSIVLP